MRGKFWIIIASLCLFLTVKNTLALDSLTLMAKLSGQSEDQFYYCASAGDVNGDGFKDIIVGAPQLLMDRGYANIYLGGAEFDTIPDIKLIGEPFEVGGSGFGDNVACAGDVNHDGYDDVLVVAGFVEKVFLYLGGVEMDSIEDVVFQGGPGDSYSFAASITCAGDLNNDYYDDIIISSPEYPVGTGTGRVYIYFGDENMDNQADICIQGGERDCLGASVAGLGDVNQDGYDDILVGAPTDGHTGFEGRASIFYGGDPMDTIPDVTFWGDSANFHFVGCSIADAGDVNGDGIPDLMIVGGYLQKRMRIFLGGVTIDTIPYITVGGSHAISKAGDLNKDDFGDIMVSGTIFYGGNPMDSIPDLYLPTGGTEVAYAGDINGDGYDEVLLSTTGDTTANGNVFIFTSRPASSVSDQEHQPVKGFKLSQNYPNPFNPQTEIDCTLPFDCHVTVSVFNILGQKVAVLVDQFQKSGKKTLHWNGRNDNGEELASGIYFCRMQAGDFSETKKMLVIR
jgi:hypothetical protein